MGRLRLNNGKNPQIWALFIYLRKGDRVCNLFIFSILKILSSFKNFLCIASLPENSSHGPGALGISTYSCTWAATKEKNCWTLWTYLSMWMAASLWTTQDSKRRYSTNSRQTMCVSARLTPWSIQTWNLPKVRTLIRAFKNSGADLENIFSRKSFLNTWNEFFKTEKSHKSTLPKCWQNLIFWKNRDIKAYIYNIDLLPIDSIDNQGINKACENGKHRQRSWPT